MTLIIKGKTESLSPAAKEQALATIARWEAENRRYDGLIAAETDAEKKALLEKFQEYLIGDIFHAGESIRQGLCICGWSDSESLETCDACRDLFGDDVLAEDAAFDPELEDMENEAIHADDDEKAGFPPPDPNCCPENLVSEIEVEAGGSGQSPAAVEADPNDIITLEDVLGK